MKTKASRHEIQCEFLTRLGLLGWLSWRPEELLLQIGHVPYWGLSLLLFLQNGEKVLFVPEVEPLDLIPPDITVISYPWGVIGCANPFTILAELVGSEFRKRRLQKSNIGIAGVAERSSLPLMAAEQPPMPAECLQRLTKGMSTSETIDATFLQLFLHKTESEIECIRIANQIALQGVHAWRKLLQAGVTEAEAAATAEAKIHSMTGTPGVQTARAWAMVQSGPNTAQAGRFNRSSGRRFKAGDLVLLELATCVNGYWSDLTRTEPVGTPSAFNMHLLEAVHAAQQAAIDAVKPGISGHDLDAKARESLRHSRHADAFTHATGHHTGFRYHDPGFAIAPGTQEILDEGMVITIEPGVYLPEYDSGARIEHNVVVTNSGAEVLSIESRD